uniref:protein Bouncer n=1 Tax=Semicossyphus pulcher TaxID=241346 RepID=UPI0037E8CE3B
MGSQRKRSLDVWLLTSILLALILPVLTLDSLTCYYCPLQHKGKPCPNMTSQCLPDQRCSSSRGRFGPIHILSAQGCVDSNLCGSHEIIPFRGVEYNVSHGCCCKHRCNSPPKSDTDLKMLLGMIEELNIFQILRPALLWFYLFLPSLLCDNLLCYYSPVLEKDKAFELIVTECPPDELCYMGDGRYGNHSALSARGCMAKKDCGQVHKIRLKGAVYSMSYSCCEGPYCNSCASVAATSLYITATLMTVAVMAGSV